MKKAYLAAILAASSIGLAVAGPVVSEKAPIIQDPVCAVPFTGELSLGYETDYIFRGVTYGENAPWASAGLNFAVSETSSIDVGAWYINSTSHPADFDELDLYAFYNFAIGGFDASFGGTWYYFPEPGGNTGELSLGLSKDVGIAELGVFGAHDFDHDGGWYFETRALRTIPLNNCLDLNLGAGLSYTSDYFGSDGWNHGYARAGLGWHMTESATMNAYIGGNFPLGGLDFIEDDDTFHGGVSISVAF